MIDALRQDLSCTARRLRQAPGFTLARAYAADNEGVDGTVIPLLDATVGGVAPVVHGGRDARGPARPAAHEFLSTELR
jgi:hypothetical protein